MLMNRITKENIEAFETRYRAKFINSLSGFKSANLIGTIGEKGTNLCIVSSAVHLGAHPPLIGIIIRPDVSPRHTLNNILNTGYCTLNHVNENIIKEAHQTSARYPEEVSEFDACHLTEEYLGETKVPFVKEANIKMLLKFVREIPIEENGTHFLIMAIVDVYLDKKIVADDGLVDIEKAKTVCVSSLDSYHSTQAVGRLSYAKADVKTSFFDSSFSYLD